LSVDPVPADVLTGRRSPGRGAYVCPERACVEKAVATGALARTLRLPGRLPESLVDTLRSRVS
jgi:predicted RNA-binding protein YlxR (DUF448 family)